MEQYQAIRQYVQFQCSNCHLKELVDPTKPEDLKKVEDWIKVQKSNGETFAFHSVECVHKGIHVVKQKSAAELGIEVVGE